jgi:hypothetical protein
MRFLDFFDLGTEDGCWLWRKQGNRPYGNFTVGGANYLAHRFSYYLYNGKIDESLVVRHTCDNTRCVNPDHLVQGTQKDNKQDGVVRGRNATGSRHGRSVLTEAQVVQIKFILETSDMSYAEIAKLFPCSAGCVGHIARGESWVDR